MADAYPLCWPVGRGRSTDRRRSKFKRTGNYYPAVQELLREIGRARGERVIVSTNIALRQDGMPYAGQKAPADPGVAVYFHRRGKQVCFCCDTWLTVEENVQAIIHTIDAVRGIERWGSSEAVDAAFSGFQALPAPKTSASPWWDVLGVDRGASAEVVQVAWKRLAVEHHTDRCIGDPVKQARGVSINVAYDEFRKERGM